VEKEQRHDESGSPSGRLRGSREPWLWHGAAVRSAALVSTDATLDIDLLHVVAKSDVHGRAL